MNITDDMIRKVVKAAKEYEGTPVCQRVSKGAELCDLVDGLSEGQCVQLAKLVARKI